MPSHDAMLTPFDLSCPYCGETIEVLIDASSGDQQYIEDCQVCCRPISMGVHVDEDGDVQVDARAENDA
jgi:hypothetical protein